MDSEELWVVLTADFYILGPYTLIGAKRIANKEGDFASVKKIRSLKEVESMRRI